MIRGVARLVIGLQARSAGPSTLATKKVPCFRSISEGRAPNAEADRALRAIRLVLMHASRDEEQLRVQTKKLRASPRSVHFRALGLCLWAMALVHVWWNLAGLHSTEAKSAEASSLKIVTRLSDERAILHQFALRRVRGLPERQRWSQKRGANSLSAKKAKVNSCPPRRNDVSNDRTPLKIP